MFFIVVKAVSYWCTVERLLEESKGLSITKDQTFLSSLKESVDLFIKDGKATVPGTRPSVCTMLCVT